MAERSDSERRTGAPHVLVLPYPGQGHINPMLQFAKRLISKGLTVTFAYTHSISTSIPKGSSYGSLLRFDAISDGYDDGGFSRAESIHAYLAHFRDHGSRTLARLIDSKRPSFDCLIYDPFLPWAVDVAGQFGLPTAAFFTQACAVNYIYYRARHGLLPLPPTPLSVTNVPGLPRLHPTDMPSFFTAPDSYPAYFEMVLNQFSNAHVADCVLVNTFYELESEVIDSMSKSLSNPLMAIGPTLPSLYLDGRVENDGHYDVNLYEVDPSTCLSWLNAKAKGSVVYVSFGSMASVEEEQFRELAAALKAITSSFSFLWVVRPPEAAKLPKGFEIDDDDSKGLVVNWCPQLKVLASEAVGCFLTHGGWNSTTEALGLGVPMVVMPQWTDQPTNAKLVEDVWGVGVRVKEEADGKGIATKEEIERCIREVMGGEKVKENATKWKELCKKAVDQGGSSDRNVVQFVSMIVDKTTARD